MRAIILVAGEGTRLHPHPHDGPKCLVRVAGRPLLDWQLDALRMAGVRDITLVTGYRAEALVQTGLPTIHNPRYRDTNMVASLFYARSAMDGADDVVICYGDIAYEPRVIEALIASPAPIAIAINRHWLPLWQQRMADPLADAETLRLDEAGAVIELGRKPQSLSEIEGQYMGLIGVKAGFAPRLVATYDALDPAGPYDNRDRDRMFMTSFLQHVIDHVSPVAAVPCDGGWLEVDTLSDLAAYESLHAAGQLGQFCDLMTIISEPPRQPR
jgi:choline kinase